MSKHITLTLHTLVEQVREWSRDVITHEKRIAAGEDSDRPAALPYGFECARVGKVVRVLESDDIGAPVLFVLAGPTAIEDAVDSGFDGAMGMVENEYRRGFMDGQRGRKVYEDAPTESVGWHPRSEP